MTLIVFELTAVVRPPGAARAARLRNHYRCGNDRARAEVRLPFALRARCWRSMDRR